MSWKLYLEDIRTPRDSTFIIARSFDDAVGLVLSCGVSSFISFDHDLGMGGKGNFRNESNLRIEHR